MLQYYAVYFIWFHQINFFSKIADLPVLAEKKKKRKEKKKTFIETWPSLQQVSNVCQVKQNTLFTFLYHLSLLTM